MRSVVFRPTLEADIDATFEVRASTRENPISRRQLEEWGFTPQTVAAGYREGRTAGWVCEELGRIVGFCSGDVPSGEIIVLAVLPECEGHGLGLGLLARLVATLRERGAPRLWLSASPDPGIRAHGFYRANGWTPTGEVLENGDQILVYSR